MQKCQKVVRKCSILVNEIGHISGVGVLLAGYGPGVKGVIRQNEVSNNWIHLTGEIHGPTPAIMVWIFLLAMPDIIRSTIERASLGRPLQQIAQHPYHDQSINQTGRHERVD
jgi:hypothetical protein